MVKVKDIGEHQLLKIINQYCDRSKNGDDAAILEIKKGKELVVTTDILVENVHFSHHTTPPHAIGYRAVTANLSDIAAMGGQPKAITVGLSLHPDTEISWIEQIYQGMQECLSPYNCTIVGGDITRSAVNTIAITALGEVSPSKAMYRHTAHIGDLIVITGIHGLARAGLEILLNPEKYAHIPSEIKEKVIFAHQYPQPRLDVIQWLQESLSTHRITAMDSSDGLADAIVQICQCSNVGSIVDLQKIPLSQEIVAITDTETALDWTLYGGEDFQLVLCIDPETINKMNTQFLQECHIIGKITAPSEIKLIDESNIYPKLLLNQKRSFQHF